MEKQAPPQSTQSARWRGEWAFVAAGFNVAAAQGLLIRLLLVSFSGNELSIGLMLGNWLLAEAAGSLVAGRLAHRLRNARRCFALLQAAFALTLLAVVCAGYLVRRIAGAAPGEALGFSAIFWTSLLLLAPLSAIHGAMFSIGCSSSPERSGGGRISSPERSGGDCDTYDPNSHAVVGWLYVKEALGATCGGALLSFFLVPYFNPLQVGLLLALLGLGTAGSVRHSVKSGNRSSWAIIIGVLAIACLVLLLSPLALAAHRTLVQARWGGTYHVVYDRDSPYGNVAVTQHVGQYTFLANGTPILTAPFPDIARIEETVHLPLLFHPNPRRVLVIGGGLGGVLNELFKYPLESVDYAELDPLVIAAARAFPTELTQRELSDGRLAVHNVDGRRLLDEATPQRYDIVLVNLPYPSTLELNRFYTVEFFQMVRGVLETSGLVVFPAPGSLTYMGPELRELNLMLRNGLQSVFPHVRAIPGDTHLWLASPSLPLASATQQELINAWQERALATQFITAEHVRARFDPQRLAWFATALQSAQPVEPNHDLRPAGVLYGLAYWSRIFAPSTNRLLTIVRRISLWQWCLLSIVLTLLAGLAQRRGRAVRVPVVVATTGFSGMVCDLLAVLLFQTIYGYVYGYVGLIVAAFMAGLALGGWGSLRRPVLPGGARRALIRSELALVLFWLALPVLFSALASTSVPQLALPALLLLNALGGCLVGLQFPLSSQLHVATCRDAGSTAGVLYAADLTGAFLGALAVGIALLPVLGTAGTCIFVAVLKACSLALLLSHPEPAGQSSQIPTL